MARRKKDDIIRPVEVEPNEPPTVLGATSPAPSPVPDVSGTPVEGATQIRPEFDITQVVLEYSEWLDSQGLVKPDKGPRADKRTHSDLVRDFFNSRK